VRSGEFRSWRPAFYGVGLAGARIGFIGMGVIGQAVARRLVPFGVEQRYFDPRGADPGFEREAQLTRDTRLDALLQWGDYLVLAVPLSAATLHIITSARAAQTTPLGVAIGAVDATSASFISWGGAEHDRVS
jgi:phosphonate dehydrogenase